MNKIHTISGVDYILHKNIGWCKNCQMKYECEHRFFIIECGCTGCLVSGGITVKAKVYGHTSQNISIWKNMNTGEFITNYDLFSIKGGFDT